MQCGDAGRIARSASTMGLHRPFPTQSGLMQCLSALKPASARKGLWLSDATRPSSTDILVDVWPARTHDAAHQGWHGIRSLGQRRLLHFAFRISLLAPCPSLSNTRCVLLDIGTNQVRSKRESALLGANSDQNCRNYCQAYVYLDTHLNKHRHVA